MTPTIICRKGANDTKKNGVFCMEKTFAFFTTLQQVLASTRLSPAY
jgi:hypothetical protein